MFQQVASKTRMRQSQVARSSLFQELACLELICSRGSLGFVPMQLRSHRAKCLRLSVPGQSREELQSRSIDARKQVPRQPASCFCSTAPCALRSDAGTRREGHNAAPYALEQGCMTLRCIQQLRQCSVLERKASCQECLFQSRCRFIFGDNTQIFCLRT